MAWIRSRVGALCLQLCWQILYEIIYLPVVIRYFYTARFRYVRRCVLWALCLAEECVYLLFGHARVLARIFSAPHIGCSWSHELNNELFISMVAGGVPFTIGFTLHCRICLAIDRTLRSHAFISDAADLKQSLSFN